MAEYYDTPTAPHQPTDQEVELFQKTMREFNEASMARHPFEREWEELAQILLPAYSGTFTFGSYQMPGRKVGQNQIDSTGNLALGRFAAICNSLTTPRNMRYQRLIASNRELRKIRRVNLWFDEAADILFDERYKGHGNFEAQNNNNFLMLGAFGHQYMFVDEYIDPVTKVPNGTRYRSCPPGEVYLVENHQGVVVAFFRWFRYTAQQTVDHFGMARLPESMWTALKNGSQQQYDILHYVCRRHDHDPQRLDKRALPYASTYICVQGQTVLQEGGYYSFPLPGGRYLQAPGEVYARGPGSQVKGSMQTLNSEKVTFLRQGHRAGNPILLTADDGLIDVASLRPGSGIPGAVNADGRPLVHILPSGDIQITLEMMEEERKLQNDAFLVTLFQILTETPQMTAREVIERTNEKGILLAPTIGRQQSEYIDPLTERELDILSRQGKLPPMPPELREAQGEYQVESTSPLARAMRAQEAAGMMRSLEHTISMVNVTQDLSLLDPYDLDAFTKESATEIEGVPTRWMSDDKKIAMKRKARAAQQQQQAQIQAMPAQAAMMKAQAAAQKTQQQPGGGSGSGVLQPAPQGRPQFRGP